MVDDQVLALISKAVEGGHLQVQQCVKLISSIAGGSKDPIDVLMRNELAMSHDEVSSVLDSIGHPHDQTLLAAGDQAGQHVVGGDLNGSGGDRPSGRGLAAASSQGTAPTMDQLAGTLDSADASPIDLLSIAAPVDGEWVAASRFAIGHEIARGGLGSVSLARDVALEREVVVKEIRGDQQSVNHRKARFFTEAKVTAQLEHPGIVPIHALGLQPDGRPFYAMKYIQGRTLEECIKDYHRGGAIDPLALDAILRSIVQVCQAIAFAHSRGILHRDIKPQNVMIGEFGETLLVDWGLAKAFRPGLLRTRTTPDPETVSPSSIDPNSPTRVDSQTQADTGNPMGTRDGETMGTPNYMSPEQASGHVSELDERADVFCLGGMLYETLTGLPPYSGRATESLPKAKRGGYIRPRSLRSAIPPALEAICLKAMAAKPDDRYARATDLAAEIVRWQAGEPVEAWPEPVWRSAARWARRHRTACASVAACVLLAIGFFSVWRWSESGRVNRLAAAAQKHLDDGRAALDAKQLDKAADHLRQAQGALHGEPALADLHAEADKWAEHVAGLQTARTERQQAQDDLNGFRRDLENAVVHSLLATGLAPEENVQIAQQSAAAALKRYSADPASSAPLRLSSALTPEERSEILAAEKRLRWIWLRMAGQPLPTRTADANRAAAQAALERLGPVDQRAPTAERIRRADLLMLAGDVDNARVQLREAGQPDPNSADDFFQLAELEYRRENFEQALAHYERAQQTDPDDFWAQYFVGVCQLRLQRWPEAIANLSASAHRRSDFLYVYLLRGLAYAENGNLRAAETDFSTAEDLDGRHFGVFVNRGVVRLRAGNVKAAEADLLRAIELQPKAPEAYLNLADLYRQRKQFPSAERMLDDAAKAAPDEPRVAYFRALLALAQDQLPQAGEYLQLAIERSDPKSVLRATVLCEYGRLLQRRGDAKTALLQYELALTQRGDFVEAQRLAGLALVELNHDAEAIQAFTRYLSAAPARAVAAAAPVAAAEGAVKENDPRRALAAVHRDRGLARLKTNDMAGAMEDFALAKQYAPQVAAFALASDRQQFGTMHARRGWAYVLNGNALAIEEFTAAMAIDPEQADAYAGRGYAYLKAGDRRRAVADAETALKLAPDAPGVAFNVAGIYAQASVPSTSDMKTDEPPAAEYRDKAIALLKRCLETSGQVRPFFVKQMTSDPAFDPLRELEAFRELLKEPTR